MAIMRYEIFNNSEDDIDNLYLLDIVNNVEGNMYATIPSGESHVFYGDDIQAVEIQNRMRAKCIFLGIDYGKTGAYITVADNPPTPEE